MNYLVSSSSLLQPFDTSPPTLSPVNNTLYTPKQSIWGNAYHFPFATNEWWSNLVVDSTENPIKTYPYILTAKSNGFQICYPQRVSNEKFILEVNAPDWNLIVAENATKKFLQTQSKMAVTIRYETNQSLNQFMEIPLVRGQVFVTAVLQQLTPIFHTIHAILQVNQISIQQPTVIVSNRFEIFLNNNQRWILYFDQPISLLVSISELKASQKYSGKAQLVYWEKAYDSKVLDDFAGTYAIDASVDLSIVKQKNQEFGKIQYNFTTVGHNPLLIMHCLITWIF